MKRSIIYGVCIALLFTLTSCTEKAIESNNNGEIPPTKLIELPSDPIHFGKKGGTCEVVIKSRYMPVCEPDDWITCIEGDKKAYDMPLQITVEKNNSKQSREGNIKVTIRDDRFDVTYSRHLTVTQD